MRTTVPAHYVNHNKATRIPRAFIYFDTEARREPTERGEVQRFRLAVAALDRRRHDGDSWRDREWGEFFAPDDLWSWVDARCQPRARTVAVAHNLAYDLRISHALTALPALGWSLQKIAFNRGRAWCSWRRDGRSLVMVDSLSWLPVNLERIGELVEIPKLSLPDWDDVDAAWLARCRRDVDILAEACKRLWLWVREADLGNWKPTGAGQSWAAYRHRFMEHRLLAHDDELARVAERRASWTGRCEVWRHGAPTGGPFTEWDMSAAYARVGAECDVPTILMGQSARCDLAKWGLLCAKYRVLAEVTITTDVPTVPAELDGKIAWPVGTFTTTLWDNELALAIEHGATVAIGRVWWYKRAPALAEFCKWVLAHLDGRQRCLDPVIIVAAKHWSRALIGRFGARWSEWETCGRSPANELGITTVIDKAEGTRWSMLQVGHECRRESELTDAADSVVSVMSWVMAECRVRLWRLVELAGAENVLYMDTDSVLTTAAGTARLAAAGVDGLRRKGEWATVELLAPRQIILSGRLRAAGVPRASSKVADGVWEGDVWAELSTSLLRGTAAQVDVTTRRITVSGVDVRRDHLPGGVTMPREATIPA